MLWCYSSARSCRCASCACMQAVLLTNTCIKAFPYKGHVYFEDKDDIEAAKKLLVPRAEARMTCYLNGELQVVHVANDCACPSLNNVLVLPCTPATQSWELTIQSSTSLKRVKCSRTYLRDITSQLYHSMSAHVSSVILAQTFNTHPRSVRDMTKWASGHRALPHVLLDFRC